MTDEKKEDKREVIAEKSRVKAYVFLALAALGAVAAADGAYLLIRTAIAKQPITAAHAGIYLLAFGLALLIVFGGLFAVQLYRPYALITLENGIVTLSDGTKCRPNEITSVTREATFGDRGKLLLTVGGREIAVAGVAALDRAYTKLCVLTGNPSEDK